MGTFSMTFQVRPDEDGFVGRECPTCDSYFKVEPGTGIPDATGCYCPYCGHAGPSKDFFTRDQLEAAQSIALNRITTDMLRTFKQLERRSDPRAFLSVGITVKGRPYPIRYYEERWLEQEVVCDQCSLRYAIFGAFGYCPDCGTHNSLQILGANLELVTKLLSIAEREEESLRVRLVENALEDAVSAFDGFGRGLWAVYVSRRGLGATEAHVSFQNIGAARDRVRAIASVDLALPLDDSEWEAVVRSFQKRHLLAHTMGVIDTDYLARTGESQALLGRRVEISPGEVLSLRRALVRMGEHLFRELAGSVPTLPSI